VHGCSVGDNTLIGMGAIILNGASVGKNCIVGAGALVTQNMQIPEGSLVYGSPAKIIRSVTEAEITSNLENAAHYVREGQEYAKHLGKGNESHEG
jgi:carbonic anhydrase/acetyltransferase-like protein (isoleucine patch superfamily)